MQKNTEIYVGHYRREARFPEIYGVCRIGQNYHLVIFGLWAIRGPENTEIYEGHYRREAHFPVIYGV